MTPGRVLLEVRGLEVVFQGFRAIDRLDLVVREGEVRFLIGPNGAGKTTLIDVVTGLTRPTAGSVTFDGVALTGRREHEIVRLGISRTFQTAVVFEQLSVLENVDLAANHRLSMAALFRRGGRASRRCAQALEVTGLGDLAAKPAGVLSHGQRRWLEIAMLVAQQPRLLLLDEPVAGMSRDERARTGQLLQELARDHTVVVVEHDMDFLRRFADRVTVLHEGRAVCEGSVAEVQADPLVQEVYLGRSTSDPVESAQATRS